MNTAALDELRALRARAYGPDADIDQDPAAMERLQELEAQREGERAARPVDVPATAASAPAVRTAPPTVVPTSQPPADAPPGVADPPVEEPVPPPSASATANDAEEAPRILETAEPIPPSDAAPRAEGFRRIPRRFRIIWAASLVATAALTAGVTYAAASIAPVPVSHGAPQIATLEPAVSVEIPTGWFGAGPSSRAFDFFGLTLFETTHGFGAPGSDCLTAIATEDLPTEEVDLNSWSVDGLVYSGCRVGAFPATVQIPVGSGTPEALRGRFPAGSALQFVLDGDRVGVFLDSASD